MRPIPLLLLAFFTLCFRLSAEDETEKEVPANPPPTTGLWWVAGIRTAFGDSRVPYVESSADVQREALKISAELGWSNALDPREIAAYLSSPDQAARRAAIRALGHIGKDASFSVKDLVAVLTKGPPELGEDAANSLSELAAAGAPAPEEVAALLESNDAAIRARAAVTLGRMGSSAPVYAKKIAGLLHDSDSGARTAAARALSQMGEVAWPFAQDFAALLQDPNPTVRSSAVVALGRTEDNGSAFAAQIAPLVEDKDRFVRLATVSTLVKTKKGGEILATKLDFVAKEPDFNICETAIRAIAKASVNDPQLAAKLLSHPEPKVRRIAMNELARLKGEAKAILPQISKVLADSDDVQRHLAISAAANMGADGAVCAAGLLGDPNARLRGGGLQVLAQLGKAAEVFLPAIVERLGDSDASVRHDAVTTLESLGMKRPELTKAVARLLDDPDPEVRAASAMALGRAGYVDAAFTRKLIPLLDKDDQHTRLGAVLTLRNFGKNSAEIIPEVTASLASQKATTRVAALSVLDAIGGDNSSCAAKIDALRKDPEESVRCVVAFVLAGMDHGARAATVAEMLQDPDPAVRSVAAYNLSQMGEPGFAFAPAVANLLGDKEANVRAWAVRSLARMGNAGADYADRIAALVIDPNKMVQAAVAETTGVAAATPQSVLKSRELAAALDSEPSARQAAFEYLNSRGNASGDLDLEAALLATVGPLPQKKIAERRAYLRIWAGDNEELQRSVTWLGRPDVEPMPKEGLPAEELRKTLTLFSKLWDLGTLSAALREELAKRIEQVTKAGGQNPDAEIAQLSQSLTEKLKTPVNAPAPAVAAPAGIPQRVGGGAVSKQRQIAVETLQWLRMLDAATDQFAIEYGIAAGTAVFPPDMQNYVRKGSPIWLELSRPGGPKDPLGHPFIGFEVDKPPTIAPATFDALKDVADKTFWGPYAPNAAAQ